MPLASADTRAPLWPEPYRALREATGAKEAGLVEVEVQRLEVRRLRTLLAG